MPETQQVAFILVRTKYAGNIGATARALRNMGFADLRLIAPRNLNERIASEMAVHGRQILEQAAHYDNLGAALADRTLSFGTTCRGGPLRCAAQSIREAALELSRALRTERIAIVFGPEDDGLSNEELKLCQRLIVIPAAAAYPSLNLAQAVMVVAWELFMAGMAPIAAAPASPSDRAPLPAVEAMMARMEQALIAIGFVPADNPDPMMFALRGLLGRTGLGEREVAILNGLAHQIEWFAKEGRDIIEAKRRLGRKIR